MHSATSCDDSWQEMQGNAGEALVERRLQRVGYSVARPGDPYGRHDLLARRGAEQLRLQVKTYQSAVTYRKDSTVRHGTPRRMWDRYPDETWIVVVELNTGAILWAQRGNITTFPGKNTRANEAWIYWRRDHMFERSDVPPLSTGERGFVLHPKQAAGKARDAALTFGSKRGGSG